MRLEMNAAMWRLVAAIIVVAAAPAWAQVKQQDVSGDARGIDVTADKLSTSDRGTKIEATGNVEIKRQQTTIKGEEVRVDRQTQDMEDKVSRRGADEPGKGDRRNSKWRPLYRTGPSQYDRQPPSEVWGSGLSCR